VVGRHAVGGTQRTPASLLVLLVLWVAFLAAKGVYAAAIALVPPFVNYVIESIERASGATFLGFTVRKVWVAPMVALAAVTTMVATYLTITSIGHTNRIQSEAGKGLIQWRLLTAWILLDSISFYGIVSKVLSYPDTWCYSFVAGSAALTALAVWPLAVARHGR